MQNVRGLLALTLLFVTLSANALAPIYWGISVGIHAVLGLVYHFDDDESTGPGSQGVPVSTDPATNDILSTAPQDIWHCAGYNTGSTAAESCSVIGEHHSMRGDECWYDDGEPGTDWQVCIPYNSPNCPDGFVPGGDEQSGFSCEPDINEPVMIVLTPDAATVYTQDTAAFWNYIPNSPSSPLAQRTTDEKAVIIPMQSQGNPAAAVIGRESNGNVTTFSDTSGSVTTPTGPSTMRSGCWLITNSSGAVVSQGCVAKVENGTPVDQVTIDNPPPSTGNTGYTGTNDTYSGTINEVQKRIDDINNSTGSSGSVPADNTQPGGGTDPDPGGGGGGTDPDPDPGTGECTDLTDPNCVGSFVRPAMDEGLTFDQIGGNFYNAIRNGPWGQAITGVNISAPVNTQCPTWSLTVFNNVYTWDAHCTLWENIQPVISTVMLASWSLLGLLIIFSA